MASQYDHISSSFEATSLKFQVKNFKLKILNINKIVIIYFFNHNKIFLSQKMSKIFHLYRNFYVDHKNFLNQITKQFTKTYI